MAKDEAMASSAVSEATALKPGKTEGGWAFWQLGAVFLFVFLGSGQAFAAGASVGPDGSLPYDSAAAVTLAEAVKLGISLCWVLTVDRHSMPWPPPREWFPECFEMLAIAVLFAATNELNFLIVEGLGAGLFALLSNLKIVFTCVFMSVILQRRFAPLQWIAVALLTLSAIVVKAPAAFGHQQQPLTPAAVFGLVLSLVSAACSGLASVVNELVLKREVSGPPMPFMAKNAALYLWGLGINGASWALWGKHSFMVGFNSAAYLSVGCLVGFGLACAVILCYLDNVVRCFSAVAQVLVTVTVSQLLPVAAQQQASFDAYYATSVVLLSAALVLYQQHQSPRLLQYVLGAVAAALAVAGLCGLLARWTKRV